MPKSPNNIIYPEFSVTVYSYVVQLTLTPRNVNKFIFGTNNTEFYINHTISIMLIESTTETQYIPCINVLF